MTELEDHELLAEFARTKSEQAFAILVGRYINLVYSAAFRFAGNSHHAEEITQAVFVILAQKAGGLRTATVLSGWLYQTARLTAANFVKGEIRRQRREQEVYMQSTLNEGESESAAWEQIAPLLDEAMGNLGEMDRNAVVLRFFENKTSAEVGAALHLSEAAAHKRVSRSLDKLRKFFSKRGLMFTTGIIAGAVAANSVQAAPAGLAAGTVTTVGKGTAISTTLTILVKGTMRTMKWMQLKLAAGVGTALLLVAGAATVAVSETHLGGGDKLTAREIGKEAQAAYAALTSYSDTGHVQVKNGGENMVTTFESRLQRPGFYRIQWASAVGAATTGRGVVWSDGTGNFLDFGAGGAEGKPKPQQNMQMALAAATGISSSASSTIPSAFFNQKWGGYLTIIASDNPTKVATVTRQKDEFIGRTDCYAVESHIASMKLPNNMGNTGNITTRVFIGKKDHLIHQTQTTVEGGSHAGTAFSPSGKIVFTETHENISVDKTFAATDFAP